MSSMQGIIEPIFGGPEGSTKCLFQKKQKTATKECYAFGGKEKTSNTKEMRVLRCKIGNIMRRNDVYQQQKAEGLRA